MKKWSERNATEKKYFIIKLIGLIIFLGGGLAFGIVAGTMNGWDITEMVKDPRIWLGILCAVGVLITIFSMKKID